MFADKIKYLIAYSFVFAPIIGFSLLSTIDMSYYNLLTLVLFISVISQIIVKGKNFRIPKYLVFLLLFIIYTIISDIFLTNKAINLKYFYLNRVLSSFILLVYLENVKYISTKFIKKYVKLLTAISIVAVIVIIIQQVYSNKFLLNTLSKTVVGDISNDIYTERLLSIYSWISKLEIGFGFVAMLGILISYNLMLNKNNKVVWGLFFLGAIFTFLTKARWTMLIFLSLTILVFIYKKVGFGKIIIYSFSLLVIFILSFQILKSINIPVKTIVEDRILEKRQGGIGKGSSSTRLYAFIIFKELFPLNPIFGKGMEHSFGGKSKDTELVLRLRGHTSQIHVGYLSMLYYYGIFGSFFYFSFIFLFVKKAFKDARITNFWGLFFALIGFLLANFTLVNFSLFYTGIAAAFVFNNFFLNRQLLLKKN